MTESQRNPAEQDKPINSTIDQDLGREEMQSSTPTSSPIGVYNSASTTSTASSNRLWLILLIVLIIVIAFFILRRWM